MLFVKLTLIHHDGFIKEIPSLIEIRECQSIIEYLNCT